MSNNLIIGSGVRVEIGLTEGVPKVITAISLSLPAVVTSAAHGLAQGSAGYFDEVIGMDQIDGQAGRVDSSASPADAGTFELEDTDSTNFSVFVSGLFVPVTSWSTLVQSTQYQLGGGAPKSEDIGTLIDTTEKLLLTRNAAETVTIDIRSLKEDNAALKKIRQVARQLGSLVFRITFPGLVSEGGGAQRLFRGQPGIPGESVTQGGTGTGQLSVTIKGQISYLSAQI